MKEILGLCGWALAAVLGLSGTALSAEAPASVQDKTVEEALAAYQEILNAAPGIEGIEEQLEDLTFDYEQSMELYGEHYDLYAILDINEDGIPELLAQTNINFKWAPLSVFTYVDGAVVLLKDPLNPEAHGTFEQMSTANGIYRTYVCEEKHIHNVWSGTNPLNEAVEENNAYILEGTTLTLTDCAVPESENTIYFLDAAEKNAGL